MGFLNESVRIPVTESIDEWTKCEGATREIDEVVVVGRSVVARALVVGTTPARTLEIGTMTLTRAATKKTAKSAANTHACCTETATTSKCDVKRRDATAAHDFEVEERILPVVVVLCLP